jgi:hypothetical protein
LEGALAEAVKRNEDNTVVLRIAKTLSSPGPGRCHVDVSRLNLKMVLSTEK